MKHKKSQISSRITRMEELPTFLFTKEQTAE